jgi:hypothetical protein
VWQRYSVFFTDSPPFRLFCDFTPQQDILYLAIGASDALGIGFAFKKWLFVPHPR